MLQEADQPLLADLIEKAPDVNLEYPVHLCAADPDDQRVQRIMLASSRSEAIRKYEEVGLVDRVQHCDRRPLYEFIFQGGDCDWALSSIRLRNVVSPARHRPIRPAVD